MNSSSILFRTPPLKAQNDKMCYKFVGHGMFGSPLATPMICEGPI